MATVKSPVVKKKAGKRGPKPGSKYKKNKGVNNTRVELGEARLQVEESMFKLIDGLPMSRLRSTPEEQRQILHLLQNCQVNKQHFVLPTRLKSTALRLAQDHYPQYVMRTATNKGRETVSIWRTK